MSFNVGKMNVPSVFVLDQSAAVLLLCGHESYQQLSCFGDAGE